MCHLSHCLSSLLFFSSISATWAGDRSGNKGSGTELRGFLSVLNPMFWSKQQKMQWLKLQLDGNKFRAWKTLRTAEKMKNLIQETLLKIFQLYFSPGWFSTRFLKLIPGVWSGIHRDSFSGAQEKPPNFSQEGEEGSAKSWRSFVWVEFFLNPTFGLDKIEIHNKTPSWNQTFPLSLSPPLFFFSFFPLSFLLLQWKFEECCEESRTMAQRVLI